MKKMIFCLLLSTVVFLSLKAQTTLEEYNYITKGYKVQIESGLDMKKGYVLENLDKGEVGERSFDLKVLYRIKGTAKQKAAYMLIYTRKGTPSEYICIPQTKSETEIIQKYWQQLNDGKADNSNRLQLITLVITSLINWES